MTDISPGTEIIGMKVHERAPSQQKQLTINLMFII